MHLKYRNVNDAFRGIISGVHSGGIPVDKVSSRNGEVLMITEPVIITYTHPRERVLFNTVRDVNPFSTMYEALWMLAGRNDVAPLTYYTKQFQEYSDDGETLNGAYGCRWREYSYVWIEPNGEGNGTEIDQLQILIDHLKNNPSSRRAVLNMWNVEDDLLKIDSSKDVCCNLNVLFSIENGLCDVCHGDGGGKVESGNWLTCGKCKGFPYGTPRFLHMTVFNRSNDLCWGALGANYVHFSLLMEYMACCLGLEVGTYNQVSNNLHCYTETNSGWKPVEWLEEYNREFDSYERNVGVAGHLAHDQATFDKEVQEFVELNKNGEEITGTQIWKEPFLHNVAQPMCHAFHLHKQRDYEASLDWASLIKAGDWRLASMNWIKKRQLNWEKKHARVT